MKHPPEPKDIELRLITGLREKGYKLTPQRREIINILSNDMAHPGTMDILKKVKKKAPQISLSTVYYTLDSQPGKLFRLMNAEKQALLFANTARAIGDAPREVQIRHIGICMKVDQAYGKGAADALGIPLSEVPK
jgi:Fe2+ or Zn2+ uptake regulation protein